MRIEKLALSHKELLYERLRGIDTPIAEYSFANLYLFRKNHEYDVIFADDLFIRGMTYDRRSYLMPTRDLRQLDIPSVKALMKEYDFLFPVADEWLTVLPEDEFMATAVDGDRDYLYTVEKMSTFRGRKLHRKRNLLKQFVARYRHEALPLTTDRLPHARAVLEQWQAGSGLPEEETDVGPCREALALYDELVLCGGIYYADGEPAGFTIGEELNQETFALHFAKGNTAFTGIYQYLFNTFARVLPAQYRYLNLEQDLDRETLRFAKASYQPDRMLGKYRVRLRDSSP